jgi:hypothetical protein
MKAAIDPVKVIPPMKVPMKEATLCKLSGWSQTYKNINIILNTYFQKVFN